MQLEKKGSLDKTAKIELLLKLLEEKLTHENAEAAPDTLRAVNFDLWDKVLLGMATMHSILGQTDKEEKIIRTLIDKRKDRSNLSHFYSLSVILEKTGRFAEAVEIETSVRDWLDARLGIDSPQAIGSRRIIARATWKQDREEEAREMIAEVFELIEASGKGTYAVYRDEQKEITETMLADLGKWDMAWNG